MKEKISASLAFAQLTDSNLIPFTGGVIDGLTKNAPAFPDLPIAVKPMGILRDTFDQSLTDMVNGGPSTTAAKNIARGLLLDALRKDALYVEIAADNDLAVLLSSGYDADSLNRAPNALAQVEIVSVQTALSGQLKVRVKAQRNVKAYEGRIMAAGGVYGPTITFASSKVIVFDGLTPGVTYTLQIRAIGGKDGKSDWSDPISKMAI